MFYYSVGKDLQEFCASRRWGESTIERLARDLQSAFPGVDGFSSRNLRRMRSFYRAYPLDKTAQAIWPRAVAKLELVKWPPAVAKLTWAQNIILLEKCKEPVVRQWYANAALEYGWSRSILALQIESGAHLRQGKAISNFKRTLPPPSSDLARESLKDPYIFDFLTLSNDAMEKELEEGLLQHIRKFLVELGVGFAFVGNQYHLCINDEDFYVDLLFYHLKLRCYLVIELKARSFEPGDAGKMNCYLSAVDDLLRHPTDNPSIGLIMCKSKKQFIAEYALRDINKPIGVADWQTKIVQSLPDDLKGSLPTVEELERELTEELSKKGSRKALKQRPGKSLVKGGHKPSPKHHSSAKRSKRKK
jgi:predicted nuclease of restriction endonuclease-like (RecB) superfamily